MLVINIGKKNSSKWLAISAEEKKTETKFCNDVLDYVGVNTAVCSA